jgi:hypothetical protein
MRSARPERQDGLVSVTVEVDASHEKLNGSWRRRRLTAAAWLKAGADGARGSTTHRRASRKRVRLTELARESWINPTPDGLIYCACVAAGLEPRIAYMTGDPLAISALVAAGLGVSLTPRLLSPYCTAPPRLRWPVPRHHGARCTRSRRRSPSTSSRGHSSTPSAPRPSKHGSPASSQPARRVVVARQVELRQRDGTQVDEIPVLETETV